MSLDRYRDIIPDWETFLEVSRTPEPVTLRVRADRIAPEDLVSRLAAQGFALEAVSGLPGFFRVRAAPYPPGLALEHWLGWFYLQEAVMGLAALALGALPGERVLDLCAAPGGKTSHLAELVGARGTVVAVEPVGQRLRKLAGNIYRLGHPNVLVIGADGRRLPSGARFDRVLVDAPCSGEGTLRRRRGRLPGSSPEFLRHITRLQAGLLRRAVELVRPGGRVLYATCTFNPEENEAVVARVLEDLPVELEAIPLPFPHAPGLTAFEGRSFGPALARAWRVYPHHLDSGGLFLALFRRLELAAGMATAEAEPGPPDDPGAPDGPDPWEARARAVLVQRFGVPPAQVEALDFLAHGKTLWAYTGHRLPLAAWRHSGQWRLVSLGLPAFRRGGRERPTNVFLRWLDGTLGQRVVRLSAAQCLELLRGAALETAAPEGDVALEVEGAIVGRGRVRQARLRAELPRDEARQLERVLAGLGGSPGQRGAR